MITEITATLNQTLVWLLVSQNVPKVDENCFKKLFPCSGLHSSVPLASDSFAQTLTVRSL